MPRSTTEMKTDLSNDKGFVSKRNGRKTTHVRDLGANSTKLAHTPPCEERQYNSYNILAGSRPPLFNVRGVLDPSTADGRRMKFNCSSRQRVKLQGRPFHERGPNHRVVHVTAKGQITEWGISRERAKSQRGAFHGREPNHRAGHFTREGQFTGWGMLRQRAKSQSGVISRERAKSQGEAC